MDNEKKYFHAFNLVGHIGPRRIQKLLNYFSNLEIAWQADRMPLLKSGLESFVVEKFMAARKKIDPEKEWQNMPHGIKIITIKDNDYPPLLKETYAAPYILYIRGNVDVLKNHSLAVVGTRRMSAYGRLACTELCAQLSRLGIVVVSGLADGIDTVAHQTCLSNMGKTIAVLGSGVNDACVFPANNRRLAEKIISSHGAVVSEYPPNTKAQRQFFPARNRIISGLSLGTLVVEAGQKSGALITAYKALEQNREVFSVPGSIKSSCSEGCHSLIKKGAKLVATTQDILDELPAKYREKSPVETQNFASLHDLNSDEKTILQNISLNPTHIDKIIKSCRLNKSCALAALTTLELKGIIKNIENNHYIIWQKI